MSCVSSPRTPSSGASRSGPAIPSSSVTSAPASPKQPRASADNVTLAELRLAARNHALPLEALRYPITPVGLHYLLTHFDIPAVDPGTWRLDIGGSVERPLSLSLDELRARPA